MKKLIAKLIPLVLLFGLFACSPSFAEKASASPAKTVSQFRITGYGLDQYYERYETANVSEDDFPLYVETYQMGYGDCSFTLDGNSLNSYEYSEYARQAVYDPSNPGSRVVVGWIIVWKINLNCSRLYNGTHNLRAICDGINGNRISDGISFRIYN